MKIACVILHYRILKDTLSCLDSLNASGIHDWKIFLVNNSSWDGFEQIIRAKLETLGCEFEVLTPGSNTGFAGGCNLGASVALKEGWTHIVLLNNDTVVATDFIRCTEAAIRSFPEDVLAGTITDEHGRATHNIGKFSPWTGRVIHILQLDYSGPIDFVSGCLVIIPAKILQETGLFDETLFMYGEDADFCLRLKESKKPVRLVPAIRIRHKFSPLVSRSNFPKEYYILRNQTRTVYLRGTLVQKVGYTLWLTAMPLYKLIVRPRLFLQALRGVRDALIGRTGVQHQDAEPAKTQGRV